MTARGEIKHVDGEPTVSVIIPVYNGEPYLAEAINSALQQTLSPEEIIVVDDGSLDDTRKIASSFASRIRYFFQENAGAAAARNTGVMAATGNYLSFLDSDDLWMPDKLERQLDCFAADPSLDVVFGHARQFICPRMTGRPEALAPVNLEPMPTQMPSAIFVRRTAFFRVGLFRTDLKIADCIDWYARARDAGLKERMLPEVVFLRRIHDSNLGRTQRDQRGGYVRAIKAALDRRRTKTKE